MQCTTVHHRMKIKIIFRNTVQQQQKRFSTVASCFKPFAERQFRANMFSTTLVKEENLPLAFRDYICSYSRKP